MSLSRKRKNADECQFELDTERSRSVVENDRLRKATSRLGSM